MSTPSSDGRPPEALAARTRRLSELLATEEGALLLAQLQALRLAARGTGWGARPSGAAGRIGVWEPRLVHGGALEFVRSETHAHEWRFWADVERIPPKMGRRIVLLGESTARGYLYDPAVTPASILGGMVPGAEVVDLARTDLTGSELTAMLDGLHALEPDAIVLFAGNNWNNILFELAELQRLADAVRERGFAGGRRVFVEIVVLRTRALMDAVASTAGELGAQVIVVVPEFNLRDWRGEPSVLAPLLPGAGNTAWMEARRRGREALGQGDLEAVSVAAREMLALDGGTCAVGPTLLAEARLQAGNRDEARAHLEAARDAVFGILVAHSPRCPAEVQEVLREKAAEHGFTLVDLPRVFERALDGDLPDRRLFLDYCHLTVEGMRHAMAGVAAHLDRDPALGAQAVNPEDEAIAHFLAAIHNAHYGQSNEIVRHHCARALALSSAVADQMLAFVDSQLRPGERWMCTSFDRLSRPPAVRRYLAAGDPRVMAKLADFGLVEAIVETLEEAGVAARAHVAAIVADEGTAGRLVDLLTPRLRATTFRERSGHSLGPERAYVQSFDTRSTFALPRADAGPVRCSLTCRLPGGQGVVAVRMNGVPVCTVAAGRTWTTSVLTLPATRGVNRIELEWPLLPPRADSLERAARRLEKGVYPDVLPVFGEIHAFTAS